MTRAITRHHRQRMKEKFYRKQKAYEFWGATTPEAAGKYANCKKPFCRCCRNPRRRGELTIQERKYFQNLEAALKGPFIEIPKDIESAEDFIQWLHKPTTELKLEG